MFKERKKETRKKREIQIIIKLDDDLNHRLIWLVFLFWFWNFRGVEQRKRRLEKDELNLNLNSNSKPYKLKPWESIENFAPDLITQLADVCKTLKYNWALKLYWLCYFEQTKLPRLFLSLSLSLYLFLAFLKRKQLAKQQIAQINHRKEAHYCVLLLCLAL